MTVNLLIRSYLQLIACALLVFLPASLAAAPLKKIFKVENLVFTGTPKTICLIEGKWRDGKPFRYEAWDSCPSMRMRRATRKELLQSVALGDSDQVPSTLPAQAEVIEISNAYSRTLLFRDRNGHLKHILVGD